MPRCRRPFVFAAGTDEQYKRHLKLWTLRVLLRTGDLDKYIGDNGIESPTIAEILGLDSPSKTPPTRERIIERLRKALERLEREDIPNEGVLFKNIRMLADSLSLSAAEQDLLAFTALLETQEPLQECVNCLGSFSDGKMVRVLSRMFGREGAEVRKALARDGALLSTGLVTLFADVSPLPLRLSPLKGLSNALLSEHQDLESLMSPFMRKSAAPRLEPEDFDYLKEDLRMLQSYLYAAGSQGIRGLNVLIYGAPGTGKTELTRVLASMLGKTLYEVSSDAGNNQPLPPLARISAYTLCQSLLAGRRDCLVLFDEIEDIFPRERIIFPGDDQKFRIGKAWLNRRLEENRVPSFWLANEIWQIDRGYLRRFDYVLEMPIPPAPVRRRILQKFFSRDSLSPAGVQRIAANENLTPALIEQAARIVRLSSVSDTDGLEPCLERLILNSMAAQGMRSSSSRCLAETIGYRIEYVNADQDLELLTAALKKRPRGRICLYGPPGTGKTAFAHYLADQLGKPIVSKRASDLLSMWLGETEAHIARMFRRAEAEKALLFLDEADSFLRDRQNAVRSWEITQVNELMVQIESFSGLFICATNFMEALDSAVFRRFSMKIKFDFLKPNQAWKLFLQLLEETGNSLHDARSGDELEQAIRHLDNLTPGDFAAVKQRIDLMGTGLSATDIVAALEQECRAKAQRGERKIGFVKA